MLQGRCEGSPKAPRGRARPARGWMALLAMAVAISACCAPISVTRMSPQTVHQELTRNVLSTGEPSLFSQIILNRADLAGRFKDDPEAVLAALHTEVAAGRGGLNELFALAELSFFHAERTHQRAYYLAATVYAYAFLFPPGGTASPEAHDPRARLAYDLYNRALTNALRTPDEAQVDLRAAVLPLPFGEMEMAFDPAQLGWIDRQLTDFVPVADLEVKGLRDRYRRAGIGAPLAASTVAGARRVGLEIPPRLKVPVTAFLRIAEPWQQLQATRLRAIPRVDPDRELLGESGEDDPLDGLPADAEIVRAGGHLDVVPTPVIVLPNDRKSVEAALSPQRPRPGHLDVLPFDPSLDPERLLD